MVSKFDLLREGKTIQTKSGDQVRLNKENKRLEFSNGRILDVSGDPDFFPSNERELTLSRKREETERGIAKSTFGEFGYQFAQQGLLGSGIDLYDYFTKKGDDYTTNKIAKQQVSQRISKESPYTSMGATAASFVPDLLLTRGMSALKAAPILTAAHAGSRIATEPLEVGKEAAISAAAGKFIDVGVNKLNKIAQRRGVNRALPAQQRAVEAENLAGKQAVQASNLKQKEAHRGNVQNIREENALKTQAFNKEVNTRTNQNIQNQNAFNQENLSRNIEKARLDKESEDFIYQANKERAELSARTRERNSATTQAYQEELRARKNLDLEARDIHAAQELERKNEIVNRTNEARTHNFQERQNRQALLGDVKQRNAEKLEAHQTELNARLNQKIEIENNFSRRKTDRDNEVLRLKHKAELEKAEGKATAAQSNAEYKTARDAAIDENKRLAEQDKLVNSQYKKTLKDMPKAQKEAQKEYSENVVKNIEQIKKAFPKGTNLSTDQLSVQEFIDSQINKTAVAGSKEASQATKILKSLFPEGEILSGKQFAQRYKAVEGAVERSSPEVAKILSDYKKFLGSRIPFIIEDTIAYNKIVPALEKNILGELGNIFDNIKGDNILLMKQHGNVRRISKYQFENLARINLREILKDMGPKNFLEKVQTGQLTDLLKKKIITIDNLVESLGVDVKALKRSGFYESIINSEGIGQQMNFISNEIENKLKDILYKNQVKALDKSNQVNQKLGKYLKKTYGTAESVEPPVPPSLNERVSMPARPSPISPVTPPELPPNIQRAENLPIPQRPSLEPQPAPANLLPPPQLPPHIPRPERIPFPEKPALQQMPPPIGKAPPVEYPQPIGRPNQLPMPEKPAMQVMPQPPIPQQFTPQPEPTLPPAQGIAEATGDFLEKDLLGGKGVLNNPFTKLAGLKYVAGKGALPLEAAYLGMKGLTSPTSGGELARASFKKLGIQAIEMMAQKYPSYHNGIVDTPQERRSLAKEIEDDPEIPLDQKALFQSKVNRGKPLSERIQ